MENPLNTIEANALDTYQQNLAYFQQTHPDLFTKLQTLEVALQEGFYQEQYALEYKEENYFDVLQLKTKEYLYGENSLIYSDKILSSITLHRTGSVFEGQQRFVISDDTLKQLESKNSVTDSLWATAKLIHFNAKIAPKESSEMEKLYKFIFLDTGLGLHVEQILRHYKIQIAYISETNLELFRLSLFVTNYSLLAKTTKFYFSIMDSFEKTQHTFASFLNEAFNYNLYIKFFPFSKEYHETLRNLQSITLSQNHIMYPYYAFMLRTFSSVQKISQHNCFFNISHVYTTTPLHNKPVLILASGPSLQKNIDWVYRHQNNFIIIAVLSACSFLFDHRINPDIVVHIDPEEEACLNIIKDMDMTLFKDSHLVFGSSVHQSVIDRFARNDIVFIEEATSFKVGFGYYTLPSIGEYATILPLILGAKNVFVLGVDLALDPQTLQDHIDLHVASKQISLGKQSESVEFQNSLCYVKGNFLDIVPSKPNFRLSLTQLEKAINHYKRDFQTIYNLSNGAYLYGTTPLHCEKIEEAFPLQHIDKKEFRKDFSLFLESNSSCELRNIDKLYLQAQLDNVTQILVKIKKQRLISSKEPENYLFKKLIPFVQDIGEMNIENKSDLGEILFEYFKITLSFIFDTFNTKNLKDSKKHIKALDKIVLDEIEKIVVTYKETLEEYLKKVEAIL